MLVGCTTLLLDVSSFCASWTSPPYFEFELLVTTISGLETYNNNNKKRPI